MDSGFTLIGGPSAWHSRRVNGRGKSPCIKDPLPLALSLSTELKIFLGNYILLWRLSASDNANSDAEKCVHEGCLLVVIYCIYFRTVYSRLIDNCLLKKPVEIRSNSFPEREIGTWEEDCRWARLIMTVEMKPSNKLGLFQDGCCSQTENRNCHCMQRAHHLNKTSAKILKIKLGFKTRGWRPLEAYLRYLLINSSVSCESPSLIVFLYSMHKLFVFVFLSPRFFLWGGERLPTG